MGPRPSKHGIITKRESELLGVSVAYLEDNFMESVEGIFGVGADPTFYEINAAMLLGEGPREVILVGANASTCSPGDIVSQGSGQKQVRGRIKSIDAEGVPVIVETGTNYSPSAEFQDGMMTECNGIALGFPRIRRSVRTDTGWPLGLGVVCPRDGRHNASLVDALYVKGPTGCVGPAAAYLSWAWGYRARTVVSALSRWCEDTRRDKASTYIWICATNTNQYRVQEEKEQGAVVPFETFKLMFESRIRDIGVVVPLLDVWEKSLYTTRLWCDLELATATQLGLPVEIILPPSQTNSFRKALEMMDVNRMDEVWQSIASVRIQDATATSLPDQVNIRATIQKMEGGAEALNAMVRASLHGWFADTAKEIAAANEEKKEIAALLLGKLGRHQEAVRMFEEVLAFRKRVLPEDHPDIAKSMGSLAVSYSDLGRHQEAVRMEEEVLAFRKRVLPEDHLDIANTMGNLAVSYSDLGRHQEAVRMFEEMLAFRKQVLPQNHPDIAKSMSNLAAARRNLRRTH